MAVPRIGFPLQVGILRNVGIIAMGAVAAQVVGFLALPILTRIYPPAAFGHYQVYLAASALFATAPCLRLDIAVLRAQTETDLKALLDLNLLLSCGFAVLLLVGGLLWQAFAPRMGWPALVISPWLLGPALLIMSANQYLGQFAVREKAFALTSLAKVGQSLTFAGVGIAVGLLGALSTGVMIADVSSKVIAVSVTCLIFRRVAARLFNGSPLQALGNALRKFRAYPLISWPASLVAIFAGYMTPTLIYAAFNASDAGQYAMADRALNLPVAFVISAVSQAYNADLAQQLRAGDPNVRKTYRHVIAMMVAVGAIPAVLLLVFAPGLVTFVFGDRWRAAGEIMQVMVLPAFANLLYGSVNMVLTVLGAQRMEFLWQFVRLVVISTVWIAATRLHLGLMQIILIHAAVVTTISLGYVLVGDIVLGRFSTRPMPI